MLKWPVFRVRAIDVQPYHEATRGEVTARTDVVAGEAKDSEGRHGRNRGLGEDSILVAFGSQDLFDCRA